MTKLLLTQYQLEFEHTDITLEDLISKYSLDLKDLKGHEEWTKGGPQYGDHEHQHTDIVIPSQQTVAPVTLDLNEQIAGFKEKAMAHCLAFIDKDARFAEVKEFKDIVSIVDSIEKSLQKGDNSSTTVNVLVQNITERFKDDC